MDAIYNFRWAFKRHRPLILEVLVAFCFAFLIWLYTFSRAEATFDNVQIPITLQLAQGLEDHYELEVHGLREVRVSFWGPSPRLRELRRSLQRGQVKATIVYAIPDGKQKESRFQDRIIVDASHIRVPPGVITVLAEQHNQVEVTLHRIIEKQLPVRFEHTGEVRVRPVQLEPATVLVRGPKEVLDRLKVIPTQPHAFATPKDAADDESTAMGQVSLVSEVEGSRVQARPEQVSFTCKVQPKQRLYELTEVPVHFLCPAGFPWKARFGPEHPGKISVRVMGPPTDQPPPITAYVDLAKAAAVEGRNLAPVRIQLPKEFQLVPDGPPLVSFHLE